MVNHIYSQQLDCRRGANERGEGVSSRLGLGPTNDLDDERVLSKAENSSAKSIQAYHYKLVVFDWEGTLGDRLGKKLIPGALDFVMCLYKKGVVLAIATNKYSFSLATDLEYFAIGNLFKVTRAADQTKPKPNKEMLEEILTETKVKAEDALMIGDSDSDMLMAKSLNIDAIGLDLSGCNTSSLISAGADVVFRDYTALREYFFQEDGTL